MLKTYSFLHHVGLAATCKSSTGKLVSTPENRLVLPGEVDDVTTKWKKTWRYPLPVHWFRGILRSLICLKIGRVTWIYKSIHHCFKAWRLSNMVIETALYWFWLPPLHNIKNKIHTYVYCKLLRRNPPGNWLILIFSGQEPCTRII